MTPESLTCYGISMPYCLPGLSSRDVRPGHEKLYSGDMDQESLVDTDARSSEGSVEPAPGLTSVTTTLPMQSVSSSALGAGWL